SKYYKYLVDEKKGTYTLVDAFDVPYSPYVSSVQNIGTNTIVNSGMAFNFQEYDSEHTLIRSFTMKGEKYIYRVYKYTFDNFYFNQ
ncbi:aryl-sulfate sulfotransferase, partial [Erysipelatoclostridium ramosum]|uniref:aryl-sulfate sulfotransferase n=1 Tax=Thomasclavelia ramosa TaxID=1547 RepID=UPI001D06EF3F